MNVKVKFLIIFIIIIHNGNGTPEKLKKLREKANNMKENVQVITESKRGTSIRFVSKSDILYQGLDRTKAAKVNKLWDEYYECQRALYESMKRLVVPEALAFLEGSNAVLECEICESPRDMFLELNWMFSPDYVLENVTKLKQTASEFIKDNNLNIYNIDENHRGLYMCRKGNHTSRPYIVHIFKSELSRKVVAPSNEEGDHPAPAVSIPDLGVKVVTRWAEWTQCSRCDQIGKRYRRGICTVVSDKNQTVPKLRRKTDTRPVQNKLLDLNLEQSTNRTSSLETSNTVTLTSPNITSNLNGEETTFSSPPVTDASNSSLPVTDASTSSLPVTDASTNVSLADDLAILDIFEEGIPCRSNLLSANIKNHTAIANRTSEVLVAFCKIPCPKNVVFVVVDDKGTVLETANNSNGVYSVLQGLPKDTPAVSRAVVYAKYNQPFKIHCPG